MPTFKEHQSMGKRYENNDNINMRFVG
jgi:hypothetical protein